jgi:hypothetical protein
MPLLNYTTEVDADKTAGQIAEMLRKAGARAVLTEYDETGEYVNSLSFKMRIGDQDMAFKLPCDWKPVYEIMYKGKKAFSSYDRRYNAQQSEWKAQAVRTAWRIVKDWAEAQLAIIETKMVTTEQVFLPYVLTASGQTLYERVQSNPSFLLGPGNA